MTPSDQLLDEVAAGAHHDPHSVLGIHPSTDAQGGEEWIVRTRRPLAASVTAVFSDGTRVPLEHVRSGIWEGTRMCIDEEAIAKDFPEVDAGRAFSMMLLALCECALDHGIHTMISNYEPYLKRVYKRAGAEVEELGRADGYGKYPVCCGAFEVSDRVLRKMRAALGLTLPLYVRHVPARSVVTQFLEMAA